MGLEKVFWIETFSVSQTKFGFTFGKTIVLHTFLKFYAVPDNKKKGC